MSTTPDSPTLSLRCPAKLNLTLAVGPPRPDGLHPIASVMVPLDFGDDLHLRRSRNGSSSFTRRFAVDAPKPQSIDWPIDQDLIYRAHAMLEQANGPNGKPLPVECELVKRIPAGAGLGGGSSNAASMLIGLRQLFGLPVSDDSLLTMAEQLGADVAFSLHALLGTPAALVTGIGEVIEPLSNVPAFDCVLIFPDGNCPTGAVYRAFDESLDERTEIAPELIRSWRAGAEIPPPRNDLAAAASHVCPEIGDTIRAIQSQQLKPRLTGSGSVLFVIPESQEQAIAIAKRFTGMGLNVCTTRRLTAG
ncbi:MAG: 4-(cytidine 5'-diphospho)-2-C-methyl-D-erythritol kinase [Planctomycetota bacterium]